MNAQFPPLPQEAEPAPHDHDQIMVPREVVILVAGFLLLSLALIAGSRLTGIGETREGPLAVRETALFTVTGAGRIGDDPVPALVATTEGGERIELAGKGEELFPRLIVRGILTMRARRAIPADRPIALDVSQDGQRVLLDPETGQIFRLAAFGPENGHSFDALLKEPEQ
ncbi:photosynthetic complex assembly protein PuhC [Aurantiacibacter spongiae]|uniref:Photosynthetic complex assembly protein n=1 Tax=Aurantiacibacter spongiae TaxID=2488860 RepID=A0A3N5DLS8_9SPHN|nr:photosynthetic complex assembly protein PuhC [Aurantiacibacter spongiae]RPF71765.1 hypothetical protein EG799_09155 [Aurantiacibacter spongiae]